MANLVEGGHRHLDPRRTKELRDHYGDAVWAELPRRVAVAEAAERHLPPGDPSAPRDARRWADRLLPVADRIHP